jgi:hypothetical protein
MHENSVLCAALHRRCAAATQFLQPNQQNHGRQEYSAQMVGAARRSAQRVVSPASTPPAVYTNCGCIEGSRLVGITARQLILPGQALPFDLSSAACTACPRYAMQAKGPRTYSSPPPCMPSTQHHTHHVGRHQLGQAICAAYPIHTQNVLVLLLLPSEGSGWHRAHPLLRHPISHALRPAPAPAGRVSARPSAATHGINVCATGEGLPNGPTGSITAPTNPLTHQPTNPPTHQSTNPNGLTSSEHRSGPQLQPLLAPWLSPRTAVAAISCSPPTAGRGRAALRC